MAVSQAQIVDLLYKQAFGVTKTDTSTNKSPSNENIPSPLLLRGDTLWTQANQIPAIAAATAGIVQAYTGVNAVECTADNTTVPIGGVYPTWLTGQTYWIPSEFGSTILLKFGLIIQELLTPQQQVHKSLQPAQVAQDNIIITINQVY